jgi:type VI secretion system protein ImpI
MLLELSVLSYHRLSPRQVAVKRFDAAGGSLGRSEQADWYLPDPERVVSGVHALISYINDAFTITDKSTNGLFVNRAVEA